MATVSQQLDYKRSQVRVSGGIAEESHSTRWVEQLFYTVFGKGGPTVFWP